MSNELMNDLERSIDACLARLAGRLAARPAPDAVQRGLTAALRENAKLRRSGSHRWARSISGIAAAVAIMSIWGLQGAATPQANDRIDPNTRIELWLGAADESAQMVAESWPTEWDIDPSSATEDPLRGFDESLKALERLSGV